MSFKLVYVLLLLIFLSGLVSAQEIIDSVNKLQLDTDICDTATGIPKTECDVLVELYSATNGPNWVDKSGWLLSNTPCTWFGITCSDEHVISIILRNNNLSGILPDSWSFFTALNKLLLDDNHLSGPLPPSVQLYGAYPFPTLSLNNNQFSGTIPGEYADAVTVLSLANNQLSGPIPTEFENNPFEALNLSHNQLSGSIPAGLWGFGLILNDNNLTGHLPEGVYGVLIFICITIL